MEQYRRSNLDVTAQTEESRTSIANLEVPNIAGQSVEVGAVGASRPAIPQPIERVTEEADA
jgi:hypothetical protein